MSDDYKKAFNKGIKTKSEYETVATVAQDRVEWKSVVAKVTGVVSEELPSSTRQTEVTALRTRSSHVYRTV